MKYGLQLITAPTIEPVTLDEAKTQVRVAKEVSTHDQDLTRLIVAARQVVEDRLNRQLITATWDLHLDRFPLWSGETQNNMTPRPIRVPRAPLQSVTYIQYADTSGNTQTLDTSIYKVLTTREPGEIWLKFGQIWKIARFEPDVITVRFVAGFGSTAALVPAKYKQPILLMISDWFENRMGEGETSETVNALLANCSCGDEFAEYGVEFYAGR